MKKIAIVAILALAMLLAITGCDKATTVSISVTKYPKLTYEIGESFKPEGGEIVVKMSKGSDKIIPMTDKEVTFSGFDSSSAVRSQEVTVHYKTHEAKISVSVIAIQSIRVSAKPRLQYVMGEAFDPAEGMLAVTMTDGVISNVPIGDTKVTVTGFDSTIPEIGKTITISYGGQSVTETVTVVDQSISKISLSTNPNKTAYLTGENFEAAGGKITVTKRDTPSETIDLTNSQVKIICDFSKRGVDNANSKVIVQYRGHQTEFKIDLGSAVVGISVKDYPQTQYIVNEKFYTQTGALWLLYHDGQNDTVLLSNNDVQVVGFNSNSAGSLNVTFKYMSFETDPISVTVIDGGAASNLMIDYNLFNDVIIDWVDATVVGLEGRENEAKALLSNYSALTSTEKSYLSKYQSRIVGLAVAAELMDIYGEAKILSDVILKNTTYTEASSLLGTIATFNSDVAGSRDAMVDFDTAYGKIQLYRLGSTVITVQNIRDKIESAERNVNTLKTEINKALPLFQGFNTLPEVIPYDFDFTVYSGIGSSYNALIALQSTEKAFFQEVLVNWRADYLEIMLEYFYQMNGENLKGGIYGDKIASVIKDYTPQILYSMVEYVDKYMSVGNAYLSNTTEGAADPILMPAISIISGFKKLVDTMYSTSYDSIIKVFETYKWPTSTGEADQIKFYYDEIAYGEREIMNYLLGQYYSPSGVIEEFFDIYLPIVDKFSFFLYFSTDDYKPGTAGRDADVVALREAFYNLSTSNKLFILSYFNDGFYFSIVKPYMEVYLNSNELAVYDAHTNLVISYLTYYSLDGNATEQESEMTKMKDRISEVQIALNAVADKSRLNKYLSHELNFFEEIKEWIVMAQDLSQLPYAIKEINQYINMSNDLVQQGYNDDAIAVYLKIVDLIEKLNADDREVYENFAVGAIDGYTHEYYFEYFKSLFESSYKIDPKAGTPVANVFNKYMQMRYNLYFVTDYKLGDSRYNADFEALKTAFFNLTSDEKVDFVVNGHNFGGARFFNMLASHMYAELGNEDAYEAYGLMLEVIYGAYSYDLGLISIDTLSNLIGNYNAKANALNSYTAKVSKELALLNEINAKLANLTGINVKYYNLLKLATAALEGIAADGKVLTNFEAMTIQLNDEYSKLNEQEKAELDTVKGFFYNDLTVGAVIKQVISLNRVKKLLMMSDDPSVKSLYTQLANMVYKLHYDAGYESSGNMHTETEALLAGYQALSAYQQGSFFMFQDGYYGGNYGYLFLYFTSNYFASKIPNSGEGTLNEDAIYATLEWMAAYGVYVYGFYSYSQLEKFASDAVDAYSALTSKTDFDNSTIKTIYNEYLAISTLLTNATSVDSSNYVVNAAVITLKLIESLEFAEKGGDYSCFIRNYDGFNSLYNSFSEAQRNSYIAISYEGKTFQQWRTLFVSEFERVNSAFASFNIFYSRYLYISNKYMDASAGIDMVGFSVDDYSGKVMDDIAMLEQYFYKLTNAEQKIFVQNFGHIFRTMLRYYHSNIKSVEDFITWYDGYVDYTAGL